MAPAEYLDLAKETLKKVVIPGKYKSVGNDFKLSVSELKSDVVGVNPWLSLDAVVINCGEGGRYLQSVYFCLDRRAFTARICSDVVVKRLTNACKNNESTVQAGLGGMGGMM